MANFRFGVSLRGVDGPAEWAAKCRRAEELGYDAITVPDHLGPNRPSPFPALAVAATVTERPRVGPLVLNVPFYNAALLARDVAATARLSGGRLDLGLGSGHMKAEFDDAGLEFQRAGERVAFLGKTVEELRRRLDDEGVAQPPLLLAGNSDAVLDLAARHADIVGFAGLRQLPGKPPGTFTIDGPERMDERVAFVRERAGGRAIEFNMLVQKVFVTEDPHSEVQAWKDESIELSVDELLDTPQLLAGTVEEIAAQLRERRDRYGFSYFTVFEAELEKFAPVIELLRNQ